MLLTLLPIALVSESYVKEAIQIDEHHCEYLKIDYHTGSKTGLST